MTYIFKFIYFKIVQVLNWNNKVVKLAKKEDFETAEYVGKWEKYKVYQLILDKKRVSYTGSPKCVLVNSHGKIRLATDDENWEILAEIRPICDIDL